MTSPSKQPSTSAPGPAPASDPVLHQQLLNVKLVDAKISELEAMIVEAKRVAEIASAAVEVTMRQYEDKAKGKGKEKEKVPFKSHVRDNDDTVKVHTKDCVYGRADGDGGILLRKLTGWRGWVSDDATTAGSTTDNKGHSPSASPSMSTASTASLLSPPMLTPAESVASASTATIKGMPHPATSFHQAIKDLSDQAVKIRCGNAAPVGPIEPVPANVVNPAPVNPTNNVPNRFTTALRSFLASESARNEDFIELFTCAGLTLQVCWFAAALYEVVVKSELCFANLMFINLSLCVALKILGAAIRGGSLQDLGVVAERYGVASLRVVVLFVVGVVLMK